MKQNKLKFYITKIAHKVTARGHTNSNNLEELGDIINMPDVSVPEWMYTF